MQQIPLNLIVIKALSEDELSGYDLMKKIEVETGYWRPSPGTMYPLLDTLQERGLVTSRAYGKKRLYALTGKAKAFLKIADAKKAAMAKFAMGCLKTYAFIFGIDDYLLLLDDDPYMKQYMHRVHRETTVLRNAIILASREKNPEKIKCLKKILRRASEEIKKID